MYVQQKGNKTEYFCLVFSLSFLLQIICFCFRVFGFILFFLIHLKQIDKQFKLALIELNLLQIADKAKKKKKEEKRKTYEKFLKSKTE